MTETGNLNRLPTRSERWVGAAASLLIFLVLGTLVAIGTYLMLQRAEDIPAEAIAVLSVFSLLALWAAFMFVRIVRGVPRKPSSAAQIIVGLLVAAYGIAYLGALAAGLVPLGLRSSLSAVAAGAILISGVTWAHHAWQSSKAGGA
mgnify:CR=1 FL=1